MSKKREVIKLFEKGFSIDKVVEKTGLTRGTVLVYRSRAGISRKTLQKEIPPVVHLPYETASGLLPYAKARGVSIAELIRTLLDVCIDENMIDAVLDDGVGNEGS